MDIDLAPEIEQVVRDKVATGAYPSVAALIEEALFLLVERDWHAAQRDLLERPGLGAMLEPGSVEEGGS